MTSLHHDIVRLIQELGLEPGQRLPPERELAQRFRVSRGSLREAMKHLAAQGIVESRHGAGTFVCAALPAFSSALEAVLAGARRHMESLFELRLAMEPGIAALAARKAGPKHIEAIARAIKAQETATPDEWGRCDLATHEAIVLATENPLVQEAFFAMAAPMAETRDEGVQCARRHAASVAGHRRILEAVAAHDPHGAAQAMEAHILWAHACIHHYPPEDKP